MRIKPGEWRWNREECPGGSLIQIGIHHIDTLCYLFGRIARVGGLQRRMIASAEIDDATVTMIKFENAIIGNLTSHYSIARTMDVHVLGTEGIARYDKYLGLEIRRATQESAVCETVPIPTNDLICDDV